MLIFLKENTYQADDIEEYEQTFNARHHFTTFLSIDQTYVGIKVVHLERDRCGQGLQSHISLNLEIGIFPAVFRSYSCLVFSSNCRFLTSSSSEAVVTFSS